MSTQQPREHYPELAPWYSFPSARTPFAISKLHAVDENGGKTTRDGTEATVLCSRTTRKVTQERRPSRKGVKGAFTQTLPILPRGDAMTVFLGAIYESLDIETLRQNYLSAIPRLVRAAEYGFSLVEPFTSCSPLSTGPDGRDDDSERDEQRRSPTEQLPMETAWCRKSESEGRSFAGYEGTDLGSQERFEMRELARFVRVPLLSVDREVLGTISFHLSSWQPPFSYTELHIIHRVSQHLGVAVGHALKHAELHERAILAEAAIGVVGPAVLLSDEEGTIRFANERAQEFLSRTGFASELGVQIRKGLQENLKEMETFSRRMATKAIDLPGRTESGHNCLMLRSMRVPYYPRRTVAFLYTFNRAADFNHLGSLLSNREIEVLELIAQGRHNTEIAKTLLVTEHTVKYHLQQMFHKMQVNSRAKLLAKAHSFSLEASPTATS